MIHQENVGLAAVRNAGIDWAYSCSDSRWLGFIDSDDWITPDFYEKLDFPDKPEWEEMPPVKRRAVQVLSAIAFIFVVYLCAAGVDAVAAFITRLFEG